MLHPTCEQDLGLSSTLHIRTLVPAQHYPTCGQDLGPSHNLYISRTLVLAQHYPTCEQDLSPSSTKMRTRPWSHLYLTNKQDLGPSSTLDHGLSVYTNDMSTEQRKEEKMPQ
ncbi:hypothetical protein RRG08_002770 [Elysia crispata]|uniref:Uncharacterized protein n=1 Tax=Elysia crispata TaxID=231223 RepID=A0AAE0XU80_9GAST|nr:hypothetical protein RRG08_002770 [Elysia crispata]